MVEEDLSVVADTSVLILFARARRLALLRDLFGRVVAPRAVAQEWRAAGPDALDVLLIEAAVDAGWLEIRDAPEPQVEHSNLGPGEREVITLAEQVRPSLVLLDDALARVVAQLHGLTVVGTLGLLARVHRGGRPTEETLADLRALLAAGLWLRVDLVERFREDVLDD